MELKFKVGDEAIVNEKILSGKNYISVCRNGMSKDEVKSLIGAKVKIVQIDKEDEILPYRVKGDYTSGPVKWVTAESLSPVDVEFKIGDTVEIVGQSEPRFGQRGVIYGIDGSVVPLHVRFSDGGGVWYQKSDVKFISQKEKTEERCDDRFLPGDTVEVVNNLRMQFGRIGKIYRIDDSKIPFLVRFSDGYESWFRKLDLKLISRKEKTEEQWDGRFLRGDVIEIISPKPSELYGYVRHDFCWTSQMDDIIGKKAKICDVGTISGDLPVFRIDISSSFWYPACALKFVSRPISGVIGVTGNKEELPVTLDRFKEAIQRVDWKSQSQLTALLASGVKWFLKSIQDQDVRIDEGYPQCPCCLKFVNEVNRGNSIDCSNCPLRQEGNVCCEAYTNWYRNRNEETARKLAIYIIGKAIEEMEKK